MFLKRGNALDFVITLVIASDTTLIEYLFQDIQYSNIYFIILLFVFFWREAKTAFSQQIGRHS